MLEKDLEAAWQILRGSRLFRAFRDFLELALVLDPNGNRRDATESKNNLLIPLLTGGTHAVYSIVFYSVPS